MTRRQFFLLAVSLLVSAFSAPAQPFPHTLDVTIAENTSLSAAFTVREGVHPQGSCTPTAIIMPASWTPASLTFQVSVDGTTFQDLYDEYGSEVTVTAAASRTIRLTAADWWGVGLSIKVRSGTSAAVVNQTAARALKIVCR